MVENKAKAIDKENVHIWERPYRAKGTKESTTAFETFLVYVNMGVHRSLPKLAEKTNIKYETVRKWSFRYKWTDRINAMNQYQIQETEKMNKKIKQREVERINKRLEIKSKLINVLMNALIKNSSKYVDIELDFKEFSSMLNLVSRIENMNIADLDNILEIEQRLANDDAELQDISIIIDEYNNILFNNNANAIKDYKEALNDEPY